MVTIKIHHSLFGIIQCSKDRYVPVTQVDCVLVHQILGEALAQIPAEFHRSRADRNGGLDARELFRYVTALHAEVEATRQAKPGDEWQ